MKREGSRCNQAPGSTLVRKEIHGVTRAFALARIVPGKLPGSSAHLVCWRVPHRPGAPVFGIAAPQGRETPAGAGWRMVTSNKAKKRARGSRAGIRITKLRTSPGVPAQSSETRLCGVG